MANKNNPGMDFPLQMSRQYAAPLDKYNLFFSMAEAQEYVSNSPLAYVGQLISVVNETDKTADVYKIGFNKTLEGIGGQVDTSSLVQKAGDTMDGELFAKGGISLGKPGANDNQSTTTDYGQAMPYYLGIQPYSEGGRVYYRSASEVKEDLGITKIGSTYSYVAIQFNTSTETTFSFLREMLQPSAENVKQGETIFTDNGYMFIVSNDITDTHVVGTFVKDLNADTSTFVQKTDSDYKRVTDTVTTTSLIYHHVDDYFYGIYYENGVHFGIGDDVHGAITYITMSKDSMVITVNSHSIAEITSADQWFEKLVTEEFWVGDKQVINSARKAVFDGGVYDTDTSRCYSPNNPPPASLVKFNQKIMNRGFANDSFFDTTRNVGSTLTVHNCCFSTLANDSDYNDDYSHFYILFNIITPYAVPLTSRNITAYIKGGINANGYFYHKDKLCIVYGMYSSDAGINTTYIRYYEVE